MKKLKLAFWKADDITLVIKLVESVGFRESKEHGYIHVGGDCLTVFTYYDFRLILPESKWIAHDVDSITYTSKESRDRDLKKIVEHISKELFTRSKPKVKVDGPVTIYSWEEK